MAEKEKVETLTYEEALAQLQAIVETLERGEQPLDEAVRLFERGRALLAHCSRLLEQARMKVRLLTDEGENPDLPEDLRPFFDGEE